MSIINLSDFYSYYNSHNNIKIIVVMTMIMITIMMINNNT